MDDWTIATLYLLLLPVILVGLTAFLAWKTKYAPMAQLDRASAF